MKILSLTILVISIVLMGILLSFYLVGPRAELDALSELIFASPGLNDSVQLRNQLLLFLAEAEKRNFLILGIPLFVLNLLSFISWLKINKLERDQ